MKNIFRILFNSALSAIIFYLSFGIVIDYRCLKTMAENDSILAIELVNSRTEHSKTYIANNNKIIIESYINTIHYKDNYNDEKETWKDIDLTVIDNKIDKAPYILTIDNSTLTYNITDKKTGDNLIISGVGSLEAFNTGFKLTRIVNDNTELWKANAEFSIIQKGDGISIKAIAYDATGKELNIVGVIENGKFVESIDNKEFVDIVYPVTIHPTIDTQINNEANDLFIRFSNNYVDDTTNFFYIGDYDGVNKGYSCALRFAEVNIPNSANITTSYLSFRPYDNDTSSDCFARISCEDADSTDNFTGIDWATFATRFANNTTAIVDWDNIESWSTGNWYDTPSVNAPIQEVVDRVGWISGSSMVFFVEDSDYRSSNSHNRQPYSYGGDSNYGAKLHVEYEIITPTIIYPPTEFLVTNEGAITTNINWIEGLNSTYTMIRVSIFDFPTTATSDELLYYGSSENLSTTDFLVDKTYFATAWGFDSDNITYSSTHTNFYIGGDDLVLSHLYALIPLLVLLILSLIFYGKGLVHIMTFGYDICLAYMAISGEWELLFYAPIIGVGLITILLFVYSMTKGDWL